MNGIAHQSLRLLCLYYQDVLVHTKAPLYYNIQCGRANAATILDMPGDHTGQNVSSRNKYWSEITGLFWAWKNLPPEDFNGLCSYRRFFNFNFDATRPVKLVNQDEAQAAIDNIRMPDMEALFREVDIVVPIPYTYAYSIRRVCSMNYNDADFAILETILRELSPDYLASYCDYMYRSNTMIGHNMFIAPRAIYTDYCAWAFKILLEAERQIKPDNYPVQQVRVLGYMHEILLGVYIRRNSLSVKQSQITWVNGGIKTFRFNSTFYRILASTVYRSSRMLLRSKYPHLVQGRARKHAQ